MKYRHFYRKITYDMIVTRGPGNRTSFEVNDRHDAGEVSIVSNSQDPTKLTHRQFSMAAGIRNCEWDGHMRMIMYADQISNGRPRCELEYLRTEDEPEPPPKIKKVRGKTGLQITMANRRREDSYPNLEEIK